jgi:hypothetical protein
MDWHKISRHDREVVIVYTEDPCCVDGRVDHTKNILFALLMVSMSTQSGVIE